MSFEYKERIKPRITDINYGGHLGHIELVGLLHEVRVQFLKKNNLNEIDIHGFLLIIKQLILEYNNQAFWDNELEIVMLVEQQKAKIIFKYTVFNLTENNIMAKADAVMVLVHSKNQKPVKPSIFFEMLNNEYKPTEQFK